MEQQAKGNHWLLSGFRGRISEIAGATPLCQCEALCPKWLPGSILDIIWLSNIVAYGELNC